MNLCFCSGEDEHRATDTDPSVSVPKWTKHEPQPTSTTFPLILQFKPTPSLPHSHSPPPLSPSSISKPTRPFRLRATAANPPADLTLTTAADNNSPISDEDKKLLVLLRQRQTEEAWILYTQTPHLPNPTCLSRLLSQLSYQNTRVSLTRAQSIITRLRNERQLRHLDANSLGLLAVAAAKAGQTRYATSIVKSMLRYGFLPHVKAWSTVVNRLAASGDDGPSEALKALLLRHAPRPEVRRAGVGGELAAGHLNACANLGDTGCLQQMDTKAILPDFSISLFFFPLMKLTKLSSNI